MSQTANKNDLEKGVPSLRPLLENKKWRCPQGDTNSVEKARIWIGEMNAFSWINGKVQGVGSHDDTVMAAWIAEQAVRRGGFSASFGNGEDEEDPRALAKAAARIVALAEGRSGDEDARAVAASTNPLGSAGNLGAASDMTSDQLWSAVPFYSR